MLMEISNMNNFGEMNQLIDNNSVGIFEQDNSVFFKKSISNLVTSNKESSLHNVKNNLDLDLSLKFNFDLENSDDENPSDSEEDEVFYDSYETEQEMRNSFKESVCGSFINIKVEDDYFNNSLQIRKDIRRNRYLKDFEYISSSHNPEIQTSSQRMDSSSILNYLNNSIYFFKQSYKYISNFNSI